MSQFINVAIFSGIVLVAILVLARYPNSWLGRIAFARLGPVPLRFEPRSFTRGRLLTAAGLVCLALGAVIVRREP